MASVSKNRFADGEARRDADHVSFLKHKRFRWLKIALVISIVAIAAYALVDVKPRPNGGTWLGYTLGTIGAGLIVWLTLLGIRKRRMTSGKWSLKAWVSAHVYLGLSLTIIATLHTGFQFGWNVHTLAYALMMLVIISGIYGIVVYSILPRSISDNRQEMTKAEMLEGLAALDRQLDKAAQPLGREESDLVIGALAQDVLKAGVISRLTGSYSNCRNAKALSGFVRGGGSSDAQERVLSLLRKRSAQLNQIRRQMRFRALIDVWLFVHVPVTIALLAALTAHIISVFYYW